MGKESDEFAALLKAIDDTLKYPEEGSPLKTMPDSVLADIFYTIVHDLDIQIIKAARSEIKHNMNPRYKKQAIAIRDWAKTNYCNIIEERASRMLEKIEQEVYP